MYQLLAKRNNEKVRLKKYDVSGQLDYVRDEIEILEDIIKRARHKMGKEGMSLLGEGSNRFLNLDKGTNLSDWKVFFSARINLRSVISIQFAKLMS